MKTLNLHEAAAFLHMHPEEVRSRTKRGLIPGAKVGRRWVFIENDLAEFVRSLYPVKRQGLPANNSNLDDANRSAGPSFSGQTIDEYNELLGLAPRGKSRSRRAR